ncbi:pilus assembly protein CpaE [Modicisalibacter xianhensis]|uniref:Pilus assembly protein CpaE n=1 Tax=Modicisalibacter xianhensis TaxID=442341 RepID=A0A4R8G071_9GAMM|nr:AAA family ATPase [Halomonas xianhensis]TDX28407.1 pilus assembly protein CpaE [Halomonas xianhensis]
MRSRLELLLAGRSREVLATLEASLKARGDISVRTRLFINGDHDPLQGIYPLPDALVLVASDNWRAEMAALSERSPSERPPLLIVGEQGNADLVRVAMRAGARDFLSPPVNDDDMAEFLNDLLRAKRVESSQKAARLTAVINAKGGSGASMIAANLAHVLAKALDRQTVLMDMDVQFGALPLYFNLTPRHGLVRALELVDSLDLLALEGYVLKHQSGLDLLASTPEDRMTIAEVPESRVEMLLKLLGEAYDDVVVDLPRWVSGATAMTLEHADHVLVVMEQGVAHLRDAQQLVSILGSELHVDDAQVTIVVNRFSKSNPVSLKDIREALPNLHIVTLPNDFKRVTQSVNMGSPLLDSASGASITRNIEKMARSLSEGEGQLRTRGSRWSLLGWAQRA